MPARPVMPMVVLLGDELILDGLLQEPLGDHRAGHVQGGQQRLDVIFFDTVDAPTSFSFGRSLPFSPTSQPMSMTPLFFAAAGVDRHAAIPFAIVGHDLDLDELVCPLRVLLDGLAVQYFGDQARPSCFVMSSTLPKGCPRAPSPERWRRAPRPQGRRSCPWSSHMGNHRW